VANITYVGQSVEKLNDTSQEYVSVLTPYHLSLFRPVFSYLNPKDRDILYLIFLSGKSQLDVMKILDRGQPSLCYDIKRIKDRIKLILFVINSLDIYSVFLESEKRDLFDDDEIAALTAMLYTTSYTVSSDVIGISQVKVRYLFIRSIEKMRANGLWQVYELFSVIRDNMNLVKRIYRSKGKAWDALYIGG
jgi:hypothetical protein